MTDYDIIVIGAGPIGSTYAYQMAKLGYDVALYDKKKIIGQPLQCAGLVSTNINKTTHIPEKFIKNRIKGAYLKSPDNTIISVEKDNTVAYVLDRVHYDQYLLKKAENIGVKLFLNTKITSINTTKPSILLDNHNITAKLIVIATGPESNLINYVNSNDNKKYLAIQYTVKTNNNEINFVNVDVHTELLPGFLWTIPVTDKEERIGLFTKGSFENADEILKNKIANSNKTIIKKHYGKIPVYNPNKKLVKENTILLGDAASQVKPTTGGGLVVGFSCVNLAKKYTNLMLTENDSVYLNQYEKQYEKLYKSEFKTQQRVQKILECLTDTDYNQMFHELDQCNAGKIISEYGDMDTQTPLVKKLIKTGIIFKVLPKIGKRSLKNLWK